MQVLFILLHSTSYVEDASHELCYGHRFQFCALWCMHAKKHEVTCVWGTRFHLCEREMKVERKFTSCPIRHFIRIFSITKSFFSQDMSRAVSAKGVRHCLWWIIRLPKTLITSSKNKFPKVVQENWQNANNAIQTNLT